MSAKRWEQLGAAKLDSGEVVPLVSGDGLGSYTINRGRRR
jgi:hypothetical protein